MNEKMTPLGVPPKHGMSGQKKFVEEELSKLMEITLRLEDELNLIGME